jgi:molybdenum cofactor guanylyltransferase
MHGQARCGVLLAGGANSRFAGSPKGLAAFGNTRLADGPLSALRATCDRVLISANAAEADRWFPDLPIVRDVVPGRGALGGLDTALKAAGTFTLVVCAWDMPFVTADLLELLVSAVEEGADACVPRHADGTVEPLCAAYAPTCAAIAAGLIASGERAAHALAAACRTQYLSVTPANAHLFFNVNTHDDLRSAMAMRQTHAGTAS